MERSPSFNSINTDPLFETERLRLFHWTVSDLPVLTKILSDPEVIRFIEDGVPFDQNRTLDFIYKMERSTRQRGYARWKVVERSTGETIGSCGYGFMEETSEIELGYLFARRFWGNGYATEAAAASADYGFNILGFREIISLTSPENVASQKVLQKIGFGIRGREIFDGEENIVFVKNKSDE
ncbi:MAG: GNAT family N-acetyltransferase [Pyrinomonadaceae bacterium]